MHQCLATSHFCTVSTTSLFPGIVRYNLCPLHYSIRTGRQGPFPAERPTRDQGYMHSSTGLRKHHTSPSDYRPLTTSTFLVGEVLSFKDRGVEILPAVRAQTVGSSFGCETHARLEPEWPPKRPFQYLCVRDGKTRSLSWQGGEGFLYLAALFGWRVLVLKPADQNSLVCEEEQGVLGRDCGPFRPWTSD